MKNILTIDCEDWYHTRISQKYLKASDGPCEDRIAPNVTKLLGLFESSGARATFFVLGEVAEKYPQLIRKIEKAGHRIGSHGYTHTDVFSKTPAGFEGEVQKATALLNRLTTRPVESFRAPNWSINTNTPWALDVLAKYGYKYDSSFMTMASLRHLHENAGIVEIPRSLARFCGIPYPFGGAFLKTYPFTLTLSLMKQLNSKGLPFMVYFHPWEIDPDMPRLKMSLIDGLIQYYGIVGNIKKIKTVVNSFSFTSLEDFFEGEQRQWGRGLENKFYYRL